MKRIIDLMIAIIGLIVFAPVILLVSMWLLITNKGKVFFIQQRPGLYEQLFWFYKFKTMNDHTDANGALLPDADRMTKTGKFLRKTSLDELPQLLNVLRGEMSLVGPRPLLTEYLDLYNDRQRKRHEVRPGITGWAQINGRNNQSWQTRFELDEWYVGNINFWLDIRILVLTLLQVFKGADINQEGEATRRLFTGN